MQIYTYKIFSTQSDAGGIGASLSSHSHIHCSMFSFQQRLEMRGVKQMPVNNKPSLEILRYQWTAHLQ